MSRNPENVVLRGWLKGRRFMEFLMGGWVGEGHWCNTEICKFNLLGIMCVRIYIKRTYFIVKSHSQHLMLISNYEIMNVN